MSTTILEICLALRLSLTWNFEYGFNLYIIIFEVFSLTKNSSSQNQEKQVRFTWQLERLQIEQQKMEAIYHVFTNFVSQVWFCIDKAIHRSYTVHNLSPRSRNMPEMSREVVWNVCCWGWKKLLYLRVFGFETGPVSNPRFWINSWHFLRSAYLAGQNHFSSFFSPRNGRSAFAAGWYNTGVTFWQGVRHRFQSASSNYRLFPNSNPAEVSLGPSY